MQSARGDHKSLPSFLGLLSWLEGLNRQTKRSMLDLRRVHLQQGSNLCPEVFAAWNPGVHLLIHRLTWHKCSGLQLPCKVQLLVPEVAVSVPVNSALHDC